MLIAVALSALAAAFVAPIVLADDDEDEDAVGSNGSDDGPNLTDLIAEVHETSVALVSEDQSEDVSVSEAPEDALVSETSEDIFVSEVLEDAVLGEDFELGFQAGVFEFDDFEPDHDTLLISMESVDAVIETGLAPDGTPEVQVSQSDGSEMTLSFPGQTDVPTESIEFSLPGDDGEPFVMTLTQVLELGGPEASTSEFVFDSWDDSDATVLDDPVDDLVDILPLAPGAGDDVDEATDALDDLLPTAPGGGDDVDTPTDPLPDVDPIAPNPGEEFVSDPITPGSGDDDDSGGSTGAGQPVAPNAA